MPNFMSPVFPDIPHLMDTLARSVI
jgi:hypothetical protein